VSCNGKLKELWQVEQGAEEGDGEGEAEHVPPLGTACLKKKKKRR
jgi:hypothetical protein